MRILLTILAFLTVAGVSEAACGKSAARRTTTRTHTVARVALAPVAVVAAPIRAVSGCAGGKCALKH